MLRGLFIEEIFSLQYAISSASEKDQHHSYHQAEQLLLLPSPISSFGTPNTATSATFGCITSRSSVSLDKCYSSRNNHERLSVVRENHHRQDIQHHLTNCNLDQSLHSSFSLHHYGIQE